MLYCCLSVPKSEQQQLWLFATPWIAGHQASLSFTLRFYSDLCALSWWCHKTISSSVTPFSYCPQYIPASPFFAMSQFFTSSGQHIEASASVLSGNNQGWFPLGLTGWISLLSRGTLKSLLQHHSLRASILWRLTFFMVQLSHLYMTTGKTIALTSWTFVSKVMSFLFDMLSGCVITFLPRSKHLLISWLHHHLQWFWSPRK